MIMPTDHTYFFQSRNLKHTHIFLLALKHDFFHMKFNAHLAYARRTTTNVSEQRRLWRRLAWAFAGRLCDKYHNLISWVNLFFLLRTLHLWPNVVLFDNVSVLALGISQRKWNILNYSRPFLRKGISMSPGHYNNFSWLPNLWLKYGRDTEQTKGHDLKLVSIVYLWHFVACNKLYIWTVLNPRRWVGRFLWSYTVGFPEIQSGV